MSDLWQSLPAVYRFDDPNERLTVWRADKLGKAITGLNHKAGTESATDLVLDAAERGDEGLAELIDRHTSCSNGSPLVSVTTDLRMAQLYAENHDATIYELSVPADRIIRDPYNIGTPGWPNDTELFVVGDIAPDEISRTKINNQDPDASELLFTLDGRTYQADFFTDFSTIPKPDCPNPLGMWEAEGENRRE